MKKYLKLVAILALVIPVSVIVAACGSKNKPLEGDYQFQGLTAFGVTLVVSDFEVGEIEVAGETEKAPVVKTASRSKLAQAFDNMPAEMRGDLILGVEGTEALEALIKGIVDDIVAAYEEDDDLEDAKAAIAELSIGATAGDAFKAVDMSAANLASLKTALNSIVTKWDSEVAADTDFDKEAAEEAMTNTIAGFMSTGGEAIGNTIFNLVLDVMAEKTAEFASDFIGLNATETALVVEKFPLFEKDVKVVGDKVTIGTGDEAETLTWDKKKGTLSMVIDMSDDFEQEGIVFTVIFERIGKATPIPATPGA